MQCWTFVRYLASVSRLGGLVALLACTSAVHAAMPLGSLLDEVVTRNALADQVALTKWDSGAPVLDAAREAQELQTVRNQAPAYDLNANDAADFFSSQIESNKLIQYELLQRWQLLGQAPASPRPNLADLRAEMDQLQGQLLTALAKNTALRARSDCAKRLAPALVREAASRHLDALHYAALVRSFGDFCHLPE